MAEYFFKFCLSGKISPFLVTLIALEILQFGGFFSSKTTVGVFCSKLKVCLSFETSQLTYFLK